MWKWMGIGDWDVDGVMGSGWRHMDGVRGMKAGATVSPVFACHVP
jgi:hypothetical protein